MQSLTSTLVHLNAFWHVSVITYNLLVLVLRLFDGCNLASMGELDREDGLVSMHRTAVDAHKQRVEPYVQCIYIHRSTWARLCRCLT